MADETRALTGGAIAILRSVYGNDRVTRGHGPTCWHNIRARKSIDRAACIKLRTGA